MPFALRRRGICSVHACQHTKRHRHVVDAARNRTGRVEGQSQRHDASPTDQPERRLEAGDTGRRRWIPNRATGVRSDADHGIRGGNRNANPAPRSRVVRLHIVRVPIWPPSELIAGPDANSDMFVLARMTAPASRRRSSQTRPEMGSSLPAAPIRLWSACSRCRCCPSRRWGRRAKANAFPSISALRRVDAPARPPADSP